MFHAGPKWISRRPGALGRADGYLGTMRRQNRNLLEALTAVFHGTPLPIAWGCSASMYQPGYRYWDFQGIELGLYLVLSPEEI